MKRFLVGCSMVLVIFLASCGTDEEETPVNDNQNVKSDKDTDTGSSDSDVIEKPDIDTMECTPGDSIDCYHGPSDSKGVGACKAGKITCREDGSGWSQCEGEVLPTIEICGDGIDQNCDGSDATLETVIDIDGDGYTYCTGDCCETEYECAFPAMVNPGAYDLAGNETDDNCNGEIDEVKSCDSELEMRKGNADALANAMGICDQLITAKITLTGKPVAEEICENQDTENGNCNKSSRMSLPEPYYDSKYQTYTVQEKFGSGGIVALEGSKMAILSTGPWNKPSMDATIANLDTGDMKTAAELPEDWINMQYGCKQPEAPACGAEQPPAGEHYDQCAGTGIPTAQDPIMLTIKAKVPVNARAFRFNLYFFSIEYPGLVCSEYNDFFVALLDSKYNETYPDAEYKNPYDKNLARDDKGNPVGVNLAPAGLFKVCNKNCGSGLGNNTNQWGFCEGEDELAGTGFESETFMGMCDGHGGTGWLVVLGNVVPNEEITLRLALWEVGSVIYGPDHSYDDTVLLDNFQWLEKPVKPGVYEEQ